VLWCDEKYLISHFAELCVWVSSKFVNIRYYCEGVRLCLCGASAVDGTIVQPPDDTWVNMEHRLNDIDRGKPNNSGKSMSQWHFVQQKSHVGYPGREAMPPRWETATNRLSCGTAVNIFTYYYHNDVRQLKVVVSKTYNHCYQNRPFGSILRGRTDRQTLVYRRREWCSVSVSVCSSSVILGQFLLKLKQKRFRKIEYFTHTYTSTLSVCMQT
jgi:hypothetical protein